jgi:hypothetical protein
MKRLAMRTLAAACLAVAVGPAFATATSSVFVGNLVITLTDLNLNDGVSPWLSFTPNSVSGLHNEAKGWGDVYESYTRDDYASAPSRDGTLTRQIDTAWSSSSATVNTAANAAGYTAMSAQGTANSGADGYGSYFGQAYNGNGVSEFKLSANTQVTFSVRADMKASTSMGYNLDADMAEYAYARALLNVGGTINGMWQNDAQEHAVLAEYYVKDDNTVSGVSDSWSGLMSVSFSNTASSVADAWLQGVALTQGQSAVWDGVTPVPEPETYAMMLAGLALVGAARRKSGKPGKPRK